MMLHLAWDARRPQADRSGGLMKHAPEPLLQPVVRFKWIQSSSPGSQFRLSFRPVTTFGFRFRTRQKEVVQRVPDPPIQLEARAEPW